jgi:hypothetical protein
LFAAGVPEGRRVGLGTLGSPSLLRGNPGAEKPWVRDRSVVWVWLGGGPPQHETWDPKTDAPESVRTMFGTAKTSLPGVTFGAHFPMLAERAHRLAVVRSFQTPCKDHQENWVRAMLTGTDAKASPPSAGSVYSYLRGTNHPRTGVPSYILLDSGNNGEFLQEHFLRGNTPGDLPDAYVPFNPAGVITPPPKSTGPRRKAEAEATFSPLLRNMELRLPADRAAERRELLAGLDTAARGLERDPAFAVFDAYREQVKAGQVIGQSDAQGGRPTTTPVTTADLVSTVLRTLLDPTRLRLFPNIRQHLLRRVEQGQPIPGLM